MARKPFTDAQFSFLQRAFRGIERRNITGGKWRTHDRLAAEGLLEWNLERRCVLTPAGLRAYVDMCERFDAESGCIAYMERAKEARAKLAELVSA